MVGGVVKVSVAAVMFKEAVAGPPASRPLPASAAACPAVPRGSSTLVQHPREFVLVESVCE